jgi:hypothetical protein
MLACLLACFWSLALVELILERIRCKDSFMVFNIPPSASERTTTQNRSRELRVFAAKSDADGGAFSVCTAEETLPLL